MPVETPSRASTDTVYAVRSLSLLCGVISGISSRSSMAAGIGTFSAASFVAFLWPTKTGGFGSKVVVGRYDEDRSCYAGEQFHTDIQVLHYYDASNSTIMRPGMTFTIEPMISLGSWQHRMWNDDWTAVTADGKRTAQFEHTVLVTDTGVEVLTAGPGAASPNAPWKRNGSTQA